MFKKDELKEEIEALYVTIVVLTVCILFVCKQEQKDNLEKYLDRLVRLKQKLEKLQESMTNDGSI